MTSKRAHHPDMEELFPGIYRVYPSKRTPSKYVSFFVQRRGGNLLFPCFAAHSTIEATFDTLDGMGGVAMQLIGDMHFAAKHNDDVSARFGAPAQCGEPEAADVKRKVKQVRTFPYVRHALAAGVEPIPTPGHRPGAVSYLVTKNKTRYLFAGDSLYHDGTQWRVYVSKDNRKTMTATLVQLQKVAFDVLLANTSVNNPTCCVKLSTARRIKLLDDIAATL